MSGKKIVFFFPNYNFKYISRPQMTHKNPENPFMQESTNTQASYCLPISLVEIQKCSRNEFDVFPEEK